MPNGPMITLAATPAQTKMAVITSGTTLDGGYYMLITNFSSEQDVYLPAASDKKWRKYIIRAKDSSSKCVLKVKAGSGDTIDDGGSDTSIDINGGKARMIVSDGDSTWYCLTGIGS